MPLTSVRKVFVFALGMALFVSFVLAGSGRVAAAQNQPSWTTGDFWRYALSDGGSVTWTVQGQTSLSIGGRTWQVWHLTEATTSGNTTVTVDTWMTPALQLARVSGTIVLTFTATYDPPQPQAEFPLTPGKTWSGTTTVTTTIGSLSQTTSEPYSGQVLEESTVAVTAGTFTVAKIRTPSSGSPYTIHFYSDAAGWIVKSESYNAFGALQSTQELTSFKYSGALGTILLIVGVLVVVAIVAVVAFLLVRRRRPMMPQPPYQGPYPPYPPQQPPQQPPYPGPPPSP